MVYILIRHVSVDLVKIRRMNAVFTHILLNGLRVVLCIDNQRASTQGERYIRLHHRKHSCRNTLFLTQVPLDLFCPRPIIGMFLLVILHDKALEKQVHMLIREVFHLYLTSIRAEKSAIQQKVAQAVEHLISTSIPVVTKHIPAYRS